MTREFGFRELTPKEKSDLEKANLHTAITIVTGGLPRFALDKQFDQEQAQLHNLYYNPLTPDSVLEASGPVIEEGRLPDEAEIRNFEDELRKTHEVIDKELR